jgi:hypothetical protein
LRLWPIGQGYRPPNVTSAVPLQFLILLVASWIGRRQGEAIEYLRAENRVLLARLGQKRFRFADAERRCHAITVAGFTIASASVHRDHTRETPTQKARSIGRRAAGACRA